MWAQYHIKKPFNFIPSLFNEKNDLIRFNILKKIIFFYHLNVFFSLRGYIEYLHKETLLQSHGNFKIQWNVYDGRKVYSIDNFSELYTN